MSLSHPPRKPRLLVLSSDAVGREMAGTGIRSYELARALRDDADVTLAAVDADADGVDIPVVAYSLRDPKALWTHLEAADAVLAQPQWPHIRRRLVRSRARVMYDLYTPEILEVLERRPPLRSLVTALTGDKIADALHTGHHFLCASEKQRDLWLGAMLGERLVRPPVYDADPSLAQRLAVVPFGVDARPPEQGAGGPRERFPELAGCEIVLWNGGIWNWFDAPTAIRAVGELVRRRPSVRLVFMGAATRGPAERATQEARRVSGELGLTDRVVFFNDRWVPYAHRGDWLLQAECAVSTHVEHLETRFSFRTRVLDCFWARLPVVCTRGDDLAERIRRDDLGAVTAPSDPAALAAALDRVLSRGRSEYASRLAAAAEDHAWSRVAEPVRHFLRSPLPRPLGRAVPRRPGQVARAAAFRTALAGLNALDLRWPAL